MASNADRDPLDRKVLLPGSAPGPGSDATESLHRPPISLKDEALLFLNLAGPSVIIQICLFWMWLLNAMVVGKELGADALAAMSLGNLTGNLTGLSVVFGVLSAMDTLAPQAAGAGRHRDIAIFSLRALATCCAIMPLCYTVWVKSESLLLIAGQPPAIAKLAGEFLQAYCWSIPLFVFFETARKFLSCQNIVRPFIWIAGVSGFVVHPIFLDHFVTKRGYGIQGAAYALACTYSVMNILFILHIKFNRPRGTPSKIWTFFFDGVHHPDSLGLDLQVTEVLAPQQTKEFLCLGLFGILSNTEWWYWEAIAFQAGQIGADALAAHAIAYNVLPMSFMLPFGLSIGITTRVGALLGSNQVATAKRVAFLAVVLGWVVISLGSAGVFAFEEFIVARFTTDAKVAALCGKIWPWLCAFILVDGTFGLLRGVLLALGQQFNMSMITVLSLWCIGLPSSIHYVFGLHHGLLGLWQITPFIYLLFNIMLAYGCITSPWVAQVQS